MTRVTIAVLADRLGISKASVSYALNNQPGVSEATRQRVLNLAEDLGWYPSFSARALSRNRSGVVGIVLSRDPETIGAEPYYMRLLAGIEKVLAGAEMSLMLRMVGSAPGRDLAVYERWAQEGRVDGVMLFDQLRDDPRPGLLADLGLPYVIMGVSEKLSGVPGVSVDHSSEASTIVEHLHGLGHEWIAHISGPLTFVHEEARLAAVKKHATRLGMTVLHLEGDYSLPAGARLTGSLLNYPASRATAVIYGNDLMAIGGILAARDLRLHLPAGLAMVSWDDSILCRLASPPITALARDPEKQGRDLALLLLRVLQAQGPYTPSGTASTLVVRGSTDPDVGTIPWQAEM